MYVNFSINSQVNESIHDLQIQSQSHDVVLTFNYRNDQNFLFRVFSQLQSKIPEADFSIRDHRFYNYINKISLETVYLEFISSDEGFKNSNQYVIGTKIDIPVLVDDNSALPYFQETDKLITYYVNVTPEFAFTNGLKIGDKLDLSPIIDYKGIYLEKPVDFKVCGFAISNNFLIPKIDLSNNFINQKNEGLV
jgi:hypothetical protein